MPERDFDWSDSYVIPARSRFRPTPAGALQADTEAGEGSVEVAGDWVGLYLGFAQPQTAEAVYQRCAHQPGIARKSFRRQVQAWTREGLLQTSGTNPPAATRLALFARAAEEFFTDSARRFPLRSHFDLQRPRVFYPGLRTAEIHDHRHFPWVGTLEASFPVIQKELMGLLEAGPAFATVHRAHTSAGEWAAAYLWVFGQKVEETCRSCPETARVLGAIPGVAQFGTTLYSALAPHTRIAPHFGFTNAKLRCQLPLRVPGACKLKVGDLEVEQQEGRCIVFDDSFLHSAWNDSGEPRFVLVFDFFHPDLTVAEIFYLSSLAHRHQLAEPYFGDAGEKAAWVSPAAGAKPKRGQQSATAAGSKPTAGRMAPRRVRRTAPRTR